MFEQVKLSYDFAALEPHIDAATMEVHYTGHHAAYTKNLNDLVEKIPSLKGKSIKEILLNLDSVPEAFRTAVKNNGGGYMSHNYYFESLTPKSAPPTCTLLARIEKDFGSFANLCDELTKAALGQFGSGYAWLIFCNKLERLVVKQVANQDLPVDNPVAKMLLPIDIWEHAYYLKYKNKRADHVAAIFNVIDWDVVAKRFE
jgi:Fe-Mn family superoxide dismutase